MTYTVEIPVSGVKFVTIDASSAAEAIDLVGQGHGDEFDTDIEDDQDSNNWDAYTDEL